MGRKGPRAKTKTVLKSVSKLQQFDGMPNLKFQTLLNKNPPNIRNGCRNMGQKISEKNLFYKILFLATFIHIAYYSYHLDNEGMSKKDFFVFLYSCLGKLYLISKTPAFKKRWRHYIVVEKNGMDGQTNLSDVMMCTIRNIKCKTKPGWTEM